MRASNWNCKEQDTARALQECAVQDPVRENLTCNQQESQNREHDLNRLRPALFDSDRLHSPLRRGSCSQRSYFPHDIEIENRPKNRDDHHRNAEFVSMNGKNKSGNDRGRRE
jgi:hypothetical protein